MKKLIIAVLVALISCAVLVAASAEIASGTYENIKWSISDDGVLTISGSGEMPWFDTSSSDDEYYTDAPWGQYRASVKKAVISKGITSIGDSAFYGCSSLTDISLPSGITSIGFDAFYDCSSLTSISLPSGVTSIDIQAFSGCSSLTSISLPSGITSIGGSAFSECSSLTHISLPSGITSIDSYAFSGCSSLTSFSLPSGITSIGECVFSGCSSLTGISLPSGVTSIGNYAFSGCSSLTSISLPSGVTSIGNSAFSGCTSLTSISLPSSVTSISDSAFSGCTSLTSISLPSGITSIGNNAFSSCSSLKGITLPSGITSIGKEAFIACYNLTGITVPSTVTSIGNAAFSIAFNFKKIWFECKNVQFEGSPFGYPYPQIYCYESSDVQYWAEDAGLTEYLHFIGSEDTLELTAIGAPSAINIGETAQLKAFFTPDGSYPVTWSSSDPDVIAVDENGLACAMGRGTAVITATYGSLSKSVTISAWIPLESFELSHTEAWITTRDTLQLSVIPYPSSAESKYEWSSSDYSNTYVYVDSNGLVTPKATGDVTITCKSAGGLKRTCIIHICSSVTGIAFSESAIEIRSNAPVQLTATVTTRSAEYTNKLITFTSSDESVARVDADGKVYGISTGTATITAKATSGVTAECQVSVYLCTGEHVIETLPGYPADCINNGLSEGKRCSLCGTVIVAQTIIPATGVHTPYDTAALAATCTEDGYTAGKSCLVCGKVISGHRTVPAKGHTSVEVAEIPAACKEPGVTAGTVCGVCNEVLSGCEVIPAPGHTKQRMEAVEPDCENNGITAGYVCSVCGKRLSGRQAIPALGHIESPVSCIPPTLTSPGLTAGISCSRCGMMISGCEKVEKLPLAPVITLPGAVTLLASESYSGSAVEVVLINDGCAEIGARAFADCGSLKLIRIPASVTAIADDMLDGCGSVVICTTPGSAAAQWAAGHHISCLIEN